MSCMQYVYSACKDRRISKNYCMMLEFSLQYIVARLKERQDLISTITRSYVTLS